MTISTHLENSERARVIANLLVEGAVEKDVPVWFTGPTEAETIKLFPTANLLCSLLFSTN